MEKKGTLRQKRRPKGDPNPQKGPLGDPGPLKGTQLGTVHKNYLVFRKNYIMPPYKKLQTLISAFIKNLIFGKNRDPCAQHNKEYQMT